MKRFIDQTGIRESLAGLELPRGGSNRAYDPVHVIKGFWLGIWTGASRYIHRDWLRQDEALAGVKVGLVRADSGFYTQEIMSALEERGLPYIIAAKAYANLKARDSRAEGVGGNLHGHRGQRIAAPASQPAPKAKARRHVVVRKQIGRRPQAAGKLLFEELPDYRFSLYVTKLDLPLDQIWNIYNTRADCAPSAARSTACKAARRARLSRSQKRIRELKQDFGLNAFCLQDFWATEASFPIIMAAYNLMSLLRHCALNSCNTATLATLRSYCFAIGGWVSQHARQRGLKTLIAQLKTSLVDSIFRQIAARPPPFDYPTA